MASVQRLYDYFGNISTENRKFVHDHRTASVRCPCGIVQCSYDMSTSYGLTIFKNCITFLYKIVEATEPVKSYDNRTAVATAARRPYDNGLTGSLRAP